MIASYFVILRIPYLKGKTNPIHETSLFVCPSVTRLYLINRNSETVVISRDCVSISVAAITTSTKNKNNKIFKGAPIQQT